MCRARLRFSQTLPGYRDRHEKATTTRGKKPPLLRGAGAEPFTGLAGESHPVACSGLNQVDANFVGSEYVGSRIVVSSCKHGAGNG